MAVTHPHPKAGVRRALLVGGLMAGLVVAVGFAAHLALRACALRLPAILAGMVPVACPVVQPDRRTDLSDARRILEQRIHAAELRLASVRCPAPAAQAFSPADPAPLPVLPVQERQVVPDDLTSLEGCWALDSKYKSQIENTRTYVHYSEWQMCFDAAGSGRATMQGRQGDEAGPHPSSAIESCQGTSSASFDDDGNLVIIEDATMQCDSGRAPYRRELLCRLTENGGAACESIQPEAPGHDPGKPPFFGTRFRATERGQ